MSRRDVNSEVPRVPAWFQNGFHQFLQRYLRRHFHRIGVHHSWGDQVPNDNALPLIVYGNHPSWWDPLIAHFANRCLFPGRQFYAPIDAASLQQYRVFEKLGFFGVQLGSRRGAEAFLKQSLAILGSGHTALWMTPQGRFVDPRDPAVPLRPGLAHLCTRLHKGWVIPVAIEYLFWDERLPECLIHLGAALRVEEFTDLSKSRWRDLLASRLDESQRRLAELTVARSFEPFDSLLGGRVGPGGWYEAARRVKAWLSARSKPR